MIPHLLVFLAGTNAFVAVLHLWTGTRDGDNAHHFLLGGLALLLSTYVLLGGLLYETPSLETYRSLSRVQGAVAIVLLAALWLFAAAYTKLFPRVLLVAAAGLLAVAFVQNFRSPGGIFYADIEALDRTAMAWGTAVTRPVATANPAQVTVNVTILSFLAFLAFALVRQFRRGGRRAAVLLGVAVTCVAVPTLVDIFVLGPQIFVLPYTEIGLTLFTLVLSVGITDGLVQLALARKALEASERRARALVDGAPDGIAIVNPFPTARIVDLNPAGCRLLGIGDGRLPANLASPSRSSPPSRQAKERASDSGSCRALSRPRTDG